MVRTEKVTSRSGCREATAGDCLGCHSGAEEGLGVHLSNQHGTCRPMEPRGTFVDSLTATMVVFRSKSSHRDEISPPAGAALKLRESWHQSGKLAFFGARTWNFFVARIQALVHFSQLARSVHSILTVLTIPNFCCEVPRHHGRTL